VVRYLTSLWRNLFCQERVDEELDEEIRSYLELVAAEKLRCGVPLEEALRSARRELGGLEQVKDNVRDTRIGAYMDTLIQDLRYAIRTLSRNPAFSAVAVLTLALGIGANTTIFTVVNGVLLKPLPYPDPDRLLMLWERPLSGGELGTVAPANFFDWREQNHSFSRMAAIDPYPDFILNGSGQPQLLAGAAVSSGFFSLFGVHMAVGRAFSEEEDHPGHNNVVVLSYSAWMHHFGSRSDIVGRSLTLNDSVYTVIGVLPSNFSLVSKASDFQGRNRFDLFTPLALHSPPEPWQRGTHPLCVFARLKPGVRVAQAQTDLNRIAGILQRLYPEDDKQMGIAAIPLGQHVVANVRTALFTLLAAVGMVFLIACANIANLLLTRAAARQKEMSLRVALGASRRRLARQLLTESMVLVAAGGAIGVACAFVSVPALVRHLPPDLPRTSEIAVDGRVLAFTSLVALLTGIVFGLVPLFQTWRASANDSLKQSGRGITAGQSRLRSTLIVGQVAIALVLLTGAGLMTKSLWALLRVSPGFQTEHILTARLSLPPQYANGYRFGTGQHRQISAFQRELLDRVRQIPGVQRAAFTAYLPLSGTNNSWAFNIEGRPPKPVGVYDMTNYRPVSAGYFETIGIPIERGRVFNTGDTEDSPLVVVINEAMARAYWGGQNPVGQRVRFGGAEWRSVVGVVGDVQHEALGTKPEPEMYVPYGQVPNVEVRPTLVLRAASEPANMVNALRRAVAQTGPDVPVDQIETMKQIVFGSIGQSRFRTAVLLVFALLALLVASIGLYGVMSYVVSQRIREFGIRMAVGASRGAVLRLVLRQATRLVGIGIAIGLVAAALLARLIGSLLYAVKPFDAVTLLTVSILLGIVALVASYLPAQRAANADPMESLRYE
jgi:putative ABC transport system permease protein